jgi:hypothetical protein
MPRHLMLSTAAVGLMLASGLAYAQAPSERRDEPKRSEESTKGTAPRGQGASQDRARGAQERMQNERAQGASREEKGGARRQATEEKNAPSTAGERNRSKATEQTQKDTRENSSERNRAAERGKETTKQGRDSGKSSAETKQDRSGAQKSTAETEKSKEQSKGGTAGQQNERSGAAANQNERNQNQPPRNAAEQQPSTQQRNRPSTADDTSRTPSNNNAQNAPSATSGTQTNQANRTSDTRINQQSRVNTEKQVRMSETFSRSRERLAPPERNLNIAIRVGESVPQRIRLYQLPAEIVSIEPEYRDYEYFSTDDDIVIVEPGTHRIVSEVPRDPSRARAQLDSGSGGGTVGIGGAGMAADGTSSGNANCRIMRRDASGNVTEVQPSTVGSTARSDALSVTVQLPGGGSSAPITLGAAAGDIVVATQGQGDCTVTLEPQPQQR